MEDSQDKKKSSELLSRKGAVQRMITSYYKALKGLANYYVKDDEVAGSMAGFAFVSIFKAKKGFKRDCEVKFFMYCCLKNVCLHPSKTKWKMPNKHELEVLFSQDGARPFWNKALGKDMYAHLMAAIDQLSPQCKQVMMLTLDGMNVLEIADELHISEKRARGYKNSGKKKVAAFLKEGELMYLVGLLFV